MNNNNICDTRVVQTASTITNTTIRVKDRDAKCEIQALNRTQYFMSKILDTHATTTTPTYTYAYPFVMTSILVNKVQFLSHRPAFFLNDAGTNFRRFFPDEEIASNRHPGVHHPSANGAITILQLWMLCARDLMGLLRVLLALLFVSASSSSSSSERRKFIELRGWMYQRHILWMLL
jgi:hypothetical protein